MLLLLFNKSNNCPKLFYSHYVLQPLEAQFDCSPVSGSRYYSIDYHIDTILYLKAVPEGFIVQQLNMARACETVQNRFQ